MLTFTNISVTQLVDNLIPYKLAFYISSLSLIIIWLQALELARGCDVCRLQK